MPFCAARHQSRLISALLMIACDGSGHESACVSGTPRRIFYRPVSFSQKSHQPLFESMRGVRAFTCRPQDEQERCMFRAHPRHPLSMQAAARQLPLVLKPARRAQQRGTGQVLPTPPSPMTAHAPRLPRANVRRDTKLHCAWAHAVPVHHATSTSVSAATPHRILRSPAACSDA